MWRSDPGDCPVCGTAHSTCTTQPGPIALPQLPMRDAAASASRAGEPPSPTTSAAGDPAPVSETSQTFGDGSDDRPFSTATYRGKRKKR
jgi:hypothetical protein